MLPIILIIGAAAVSAGGIALGVEGYKKKEEGDKIIKNIKEKFNKTLENAKLQDSILYKEINNLGNLYIDIYEKDFVRFQNILKEVKKYLVIKSKNSNLYKNLEETVITEIYITNKEITKFEKAVEIGTKTLGTGGIASALAYFGAVKFATAIGTASTGTAISTLSGAAYTNALLAWFGGGALSAGGFGIVGGTIALGTIALAPAVLIAGIGMNEFGEKYLTEAFKYEKEVQEKIEKLNNIIEMKKKQISVVKSHTKYIKELRKRFIKSLDKLEKQIYSSELENNLNASVELAKTLRDILNKPLETKLKQIEELYENK